MSSSETARPRGPVARGAVRPGERALAPDLARGVMLLLIVLSNTGFYLWAAHHGPSGWHPIDGNALDRAVQFVMITTLDLRVYPLFAFLFGYGMMQLFLRQTAAGTPEKTAVALVRRRSLGLIALGFVHAALLMAGDIIGSYGLMSLLGDRSTLVTAVSAVGRRSLSSYLTHSLIFSPLLAAWGLGLGAAMGSAGMAAFAVGVWLVTVLGAYILERHGRDGPAEKLLRPWVYGAAARRPAATAPPTRAPTP